MKQPLGAISNQADNFVSYSQTYEVTKTSLQIMFLLEENTLS